jgi:hypothetical protein
LECLSHRAGDGLLRGGLRLVLAVPHALRREPEVADLDLDERLVELVPVHEDIVRLDVAVHHFGLMQEACAPPPASMRGESAEHAGWRHSMLAGGIACWLAV